MIHTDASSPRRRAEGMGPLHRNELVLGISMCAGFFEEMRLP